MENDSSAADRATRIALLRIEMFGYLMRGVIVAAGIVVVPVGFILGLYLLGTFLPPESREAQDPTPDSFASTADEGAASE
ncbi:MAG: RC-LH1 core complex protein PufX [Pseudomonadota bacterium]